MAKGLNEGQKIVIDGKTMAVAFMANAQHLFYRKDILDKEGIEPPKTYEDILAAAEKIRADGVMEYPLALNSMTGWNIAEEFVNMYTGMGGEFFEPGSAEPAINNETGVAALEMIKQIVSYSNPDYLTFDSNATQAMWESGEVAIATMWGSRGGAILDAEGSTPEVTETTVLAAAPTVAGGSIPATTLWWDGFTIAKHASDQDAEASFVAMMNGIRPEVIEKANDAAVWLGKGYTAGPVSQGVLASAQAGARPYPMLPYMGMMHTALGDNLSEYLQGSESAEQALSDAEEAYRTAARGQGFLK